MGCDWYLAMTAAEIVGRGGQERAAWMACHFSPYGTGLSNLPQTLPPDSLVILDDSTPFTEHDPQRIALQLAGIPNMTGLLLDLQRPGQQGISNLIRVLAQALPCPVAVTEDYTKDTDCAVFLSPPLSIPLSEAVRPWHGRKIWLDIPFGCQCFTVTRDGCKVGPIASVQGDTFPHEDQELHCRYRIRTEAEQIQFTLLRSANRKDAILQEATQLGIQKAVSLYQEYHANG